MRTVNLVALLIALSPVLAEGGEPGIRSGSLFIGVGPSEEIHAGISFQWSQNVAIGLIAGGFLIHSHSETTLEMLPALGLRGSWYYSPEGKGAILGWNNITCDIMYLPPYDIPPDGNRFRPMGVGIETTIGRDCITFSGVGVYWGAGLSMSFHRDVQPLFFPALKLGVHLDL